MIFVTIGTHPGQFDRLIKRIDEIAPKLKERIIIQRGFTNYVPKNCKSFKFTNNIGKYFKNARIVISHSATSLIEFSLKYKKPLIIVPRRKKYGEHINDHQVEFARFFAKKTGTQFIMDVSELTPSFLKKYKKTASINKQNLLNFQNYFRNLFYKISGQIK